MINSKSGYNRRGFIVLTILSSCIIIIVLSKHVGIIEIDMISLLILSVISFTSISIIVLSFIYPKSVKFLLKDDIKNEQ